MVEIDSPPIHLGIILDGNRRWARDKGLSSFEGHSQGYENFKDIYKHALNRGVRYLSAYMFSSENWDRTVKEVNFLMNLALRMVTRDLKEMHSENVKIVWLGSPEKLSKKLVNALKKAEELTRDNTKGTLCVCFNYGGKNEVIDAVKKIMELKTKVEDVSEKTIDDNLYGPEIPPVDMIIRTSGEHRLSGFMLWRATYAELYYSNKHWPDFTRDDLDQALTEYSDRTRRFGK